MLAKDIFDRVDSQHQMFVNNLKLGICLPHFMRPVVTTRDFSYVATFICHIKPNTRAFRQI